MKQEIELALRDGRATATSLFVAEKFNKTHKAVLLAIRNVLAEVSPNFNRRNFIPIEYLDSKNEHRPAYALTRDAFSLLAMGFTGKEATARKACASNRNRRGACSYGGAISGQLALAEKRKCAHQRIRGPRALGMAAPQPASRRFREKAPLTPIAWTRPDHARAAPADPGKSARREEAALPG